MPAYERSVSRVDRVEFRVPTGAWGAPWAEVAKAVNAATVELQEAGKVAAGRESADDQVRVHAGDDAVLVCYEVERRVRVDGPSRDALVKRMRDFIDWVQEIDPGKATELDSVVHGLERLAVERGEAS